MTVSKCRDEIIKSVLSSSDSENYIIAAFIAGMRAKENPAICRNDVDKTPHKPPETRPA